MLFTTLNAIRERGPCKEGWEKLRAAIGPDWLADAKIPLSQIIASNGIEDAIWALRACGSGAERISRLFSCDCADRALASTPKQNMRSVAAVSVSRKFANGNATNDELAAARNAARDSAWSGERSTARDAAWGATRDDQKSSVRETARDAAWAGIWDVEREWQRERMLQYLNGEE